MANIKSCHAAKARKKYYCSFPDCTSIVQKGGVCYKHGAEKKKCSFPGCSNKLVKGGVCVTHGAKVTRYICSAPGCSCIAQRGGVCFQHGAKKKTCSYPGCTNGSKVKGVCYSHGAKRPKCTHCDCTRNATKGGVCDSHGAKNLKQNTKPPTRKRTITADSKTDHGEDMSTESEANAFTDEEILSVTDEPNGEPIDEPNVEPSWTKQISSMLKKVNEETNPQTKRRDEMESSSNNERKTQELSCHEETIHVPEEDHKAPSSSEQSFVTSEINQDVLIQIPDYVIEKFRKVGFAKCNSEWLPSLFLGPNDVPSNVRGAWWKLFQRHLLHGTPMSHLVAFYGQAEDCRYGLVDEVLTYEDAVKNSCHMIPEHIRTKVLNSEALTNTENILVLAFDLLHNARQVPEEDRWAWKTTIIRSV
mmetsp:Transcript_44/g.86  ORF Transcript_44/g.86 Transcript_44/m.86 type:complete len:417 (-) Transcript_44:59-1309(-)